VEIRKLKTKKKKLQQKKEVREAKKQRQQAVKQKSKGKKTVMAQSSSANPYKGVPADYDIEAIEPIEIPVDDDYSSSEEEPRIFPDKKPNEVDESIEVGDDTDEETVE